LAFLSEVSEIMHFDLAVALPFFINENKEIDPAEDSQTLEMNFNDIRRIFN